MMAGELLAWSRIMDMSDLVWFTVSAIAWCGTCHFFKLR